MPFRLSEHPDPFQDAYLSWTDWCFPKYDGDVNRQVWAPKAEFFDGIEVIAQEGHGIINARIIFDENCVTPWAQAEMGGNDAYHRQFTSDGALYKFSIRDVDGFGIVDAMLHFDQSTLSANTGSLESPWIVDHPKDGNVVERTHSEMVLAGRKLQHSDWCFVGMESKGDADLPVQTGPFITRKSGCHWLRS